MSSRCWALSNVMCSMQDAQGCPASRLRRMEYAVYKAHVVPCSDSRLQWGTTNGSLLSGSGPLAALAGSVRGEEARRGPGVVRSGARGGPFWPSAGSPPSGPKITSSLEAAGQRARAAPRPRDKAPAQLTSGPRHRAGDAIWLPRSPQWQPRQEGSARFQ